MQREILHSVKTYCHYTQSKIELSKSVKMLIPWGKQFSQAGLGSKTRCTDLSQTVRSKFWWRKCVLDTLFDEIEQVI